MSPLSTSAACDVEIERDIRHRRHEDPTITVVRTAVEHLDQHFRIVPVEEPEQPRLAGSPDSRSSLADSAIRRLVAHAHPVAAVEDERCRRGPAVRVAAVVNRCRRYRPKDHQRGYTKSPGTPHFTSPAQLPAIST